jgi:hypothetical protein
MMMVALGYGICDVDHYDLHGGHHANQYIFPSTDYIVNNSNWGGLFTWLRATSLHGGVPDPQDQ